MGSCAAPSAKRDDKFITTDYLQQRLKNSLFRYKNRPYRERNHRSGGKSRKVHVA
ncbi:TPA: hypothetical protein HIB58_004399 [Escherichia coli]|nr:hypothetical protein [Salmonella enterica subsp. enterica serovar Agbeni]EDX6998971.1 hypothetical protein [Salmonella enterica subsp. enterica serovar Javiana]EDY7099377.1 hypothetical protein [Salmonella enterica]EFH2515488.1 hypothetical protein [Escherichia coli]EGB74494.1 hypothetical protein HMPREF9532_05092 [Escherichia coli MS 57-2]EGB79576.1 hypothetical protein HMPREF9533_05663 [Escherichia coli MS 60-1]KXA27430.1 hypothetical protein HMPREF3197_01799 [Klebsiella pneumoniae]HAE7